MAGPTFAARRVEAGQHGHPRPSAGGRRTEEKGGQKAQALGRSRGGFSTKLSAATDALGNPCRLLAGPGQENDMLKALNLVDGIKPGAVLADRAYDADRLIDAILNAGAEPVIPPRRHRKHQHAYDKALYKERNVIERFACSLEPMAFTGSLNKLKQFRRVATRYDKLLNNLMGFVKIAAIAICLR